MKGCVKFLLCYHFESSFNTHFLTDTLVFCDSINTSFTTYTGFPSHSASPSKFSFLLIKPSITRPPPYLTDMLHPYIPPRPLRSSDSNLLTVPRTKHRTWGDRAFSVAAPSLWNSLPQHIRDSVDLITFKSRLKTHLFCTAFNP